MTDFPDYDPANHTRPKRGKRISAFTNKPTDLSEETELQVICFAKYEKQRLRDPHLRHLTRLFAIAPNDGPIPMNRRVLAKRMGKKRGPWDAQFLDKRRGFACTWIEFKAPDGRLTPEQEDYFQWLADTPIRAVEVRSLNEFIKVIT